MNLVWITMLSGLLGFAVVYQYRARAQSQNTAAQKPQKPSEPLPPTPTTLTPLQPPSQVGPSQSGPTPTPQTPPLMDDPRYQNPSQPMTQRYGYDWYQSLKNRILAHCWKSNKGREKALNSLEEAYKRCQTSAVFCELFASTLGDLENWDKIQFVSEFKELARDLTNEFLWGPLRQVAFFNRYSEHFVPDAKIKSQLEDILYKMKQNQIPIPEVFWGTVQVDTEREPSLSVAVKLLTGAGLNVSAEDLVIGEQNWMRRNAALDQKALTLWEVAKCK